jgi:cell division septation protein DedD
MWTVQLGAYKNPKGAQKVGQTAQKWGDVRYIKKVFKGKELTVVQVGLFDDRDKAVNLDSSIRATTDLRGRIVKVQQ